MDKKVLLKQLKELDAKVDKFNRDFDDLQEQLFDIHVTISLIEDALTPGEVKAERKKKADEEWQRFVEEIPFWWEGWVLWEKVM